MSTYNLNMSPEAMPNTRQATETGVDQLTVQRLHGITTIDGRYAKDLVEIKPFASEFALIGARAEIETKHFVQLSKYGVIRTLDEKEVDFLENFGPGLTDDQALRVKELESVSDHDVDAVRKMIRETLVGTSMEDLIPYDHLFLTSEDVNNIAYRLLFMRASREIVVPAIRNVVFKLADMAEPEAETTMAGRTHGQKAVPTSLGKEEMVFARRMNRQLKKLEDVQFTGKLNGAIGNFNAHYFVRPDVDWQEYAKEFVEGFGLEYNPVTTQINDYDDMIEAFQTYIRINGIFLDLDQDMWRYISDHWMSQEVDKTKTGSSTMAQKVNPIRYENSEGNITMADGMFETFSRKLRTSRLQRDLSDSTVIRNATTALAYSLLAYKNTLKGLGNVHPNYPLIDKELNSDWSMLTEAAQSQMRMDGDPDAYEKVKKAARGVEIDANSWKEWVDGLPGLKPESAEKLKELTPGKYVGIGSKITKDAIAEVRKATEEK